ncbi:MULTISPECIES: beta-ketoacyl-ACP synthase III [unclassified Enterococcus]|uniref:beta-ketoacyl-ACP synthase III n=1 Tax=unclassified Enterococcus TaxID=2608891 RepID=UPI00190390F4|nr:MULTISPECIES: beta-ketoacyl-ACP synthase III [unclassified Enterococcus]MBK0036233.1 ketoacyl-ACP synthase III [Enterococcus sp. S52]MBK0068891.1 ketoacyl-ACP synthase III [Enterococcus sp. S53]MBK0139484.1 ketoacyl-ACP synthase III [Enterococcus sp. S76]MBK0143119.1 ketoacyl-ACP synthase III [Enterococcus sp. S77]
MNMFGKITATASYVPEKIVTNDDLSNLMDTSDEWIHSRTGIKRRRVAVGENTSDLCIRVAQTLLQDTQLSAESLDFILVATITPDFNTPAVACQVQGAIGAVNAFAFDISAACAGFVYALSMAEKLIRTGAKKGLVIGGEVLSKVLDWNDRSTAVLFGDGAGGLLLEASSEQHLLKESLKADGTRGMSLTSGFRTNENPFSQNAPAYSACMQMIGREIFDFATRDVVASINDLTQDEAIDYFLLHQANSRILDKVARKLKQPREKFLQNMQDYGNTSAASIPLLLDEEIKRGTLSLGSGQKVVFSGFGGGLTWGTMLVTL